MISVSLFITIMSFVGVIWVGVDMWRGATLSIIDKIIITMCMFNTLIVFAKDLK